MTSAKILGQLKAEGRQRRSVKDEMRENLIAKLAASEKLFPGIIGYDETVIPQIVNAILSRHDVLLLGLRGQAKTRILRSMVDFLDPEVPVIAGSEVNDDPFSPISKFGRDRLSEAGDDCPIEWIGRDQRYHEKLATPDVTIADLIGEIDMIRVAEGRYLSSEATMHFGLVPRTNRGVFCLNELPDLSPKIQVGLFNCLEERDVQIRGYPVRIALDVVMVFTANPEDYTNRGRIVTPLKDRIGSVVRTHYPLTRDVGIQITDNEAWTSRNGQCHVHVPGFMKAIIEELSRLARKSQHVSQQSGVSVRMSIANYETMLSNVERRGILTGEEQLAPRISDLAYLGASSRGKIELSLSEEDGYEDVVIGRLLAEAIANVFTEELELPPLRPIVEHFRQGNEIIVGEGLTSDRYADAVGKVPGLQRLVGELVGRLCPELDEDATRDAAGASVAEFVLEGLHVHNKLNKRAEADGIAYRG